MRAEALDQMGVCVTANFHNNPTNNETERQSCNLMTAEAPSEISPEEVKGVCV